MSRWMYVDWDWYFKKEDLWIGAFWKKERNGTSSEYENLTIYICLLPCCVLEFLWMRSNPPKT